MLFLVKAEHLTAPYPHPFGPYRWSHQTTRPGHHDRAQLCHDRCPAPAVPPGAPSPAGTLPGHVPIPGHRLPCSSTSRARALCGVWGSYWSLCLGRAWGQVPGAGLSAAKHPQTAPLTPALPQPICTGVPCLQSPQECTPACWGPQPQAPPDPAGHSSVGPQAPSAALEPSGAAPHGTAGTGAARPEQGCLWEGSTPHTPAHPGAASWAEGTELRGSAGCQGSGPGTGRSSPGFGRRRQSRGAGSGGAGRAGAAAGLAAR